MTGPVRSPAPDPRVVEIVVHAVLVSWPVTREWLFAPDRKQPGAEARQVAMHLLSRVSASSWEAVAAVFGRRDHGTVRCALERVQELRDVYPVEAARIRRAEQMVDGMLSKLMGTRRAA